MNTGERIAARPTPSRTLRGRAEDGFRATLRDGREIEVAHARDCRLGGSFRDGKGQPGQISAVSHGCPTTHFAGVNVINTGCTLG